MKKFRAELFPLFFVVLFIYHAPATAGKTIQLSGSSFAAENLALQPAWEEYQIFYIDSIFNLINGGVTRVFAELNGHRFILTTYPSELNRGQNIFLIPRQDTVIMHIGNYLVHDDFTQPKNLLRLLLQGPAGSDAIILIGDQPVVPRLDFTLNLVNLPSDFFLLQNFPNPFNSSTTLRFAVPDQFLFGIQAELIIYNLLGQKVIHLFKGKVFPGLIEQSWNGRTERGLPAASGVYVARLRIGDWYAARRILLLK